jgi:uncharacterized integral membrane protein
LVRLVYWGLTLLAAIVCAGFAVYNRNSVTLDLWPFATVELPLYLVVLGMLATGLLLGSSITWLGHLGIRRERRRLAKQVRRLESSPARATEPPPPGRALAN